MLVCTQPLLYKDYNSIKGKHRGVALSKYEYYKNTVQAYDPSERFLPCGKCLSCKKKAINRWKQRAYWESLYYKKNEMWFVTLTYNDASVPIKETVTDEGKIVRMPTLVKRDYQLFIKLLRSHFPGVKIKYFLSGEYGSRSTLRCHFHIVFFGLPLKDLTVFYRQKAGKFKGEPTYRSVLLERLWDKGYVEVKAATPETIGYVAGYSVKGSKDPTKPDPFAAKGYRSPQFIIMSKGIAERYWNDHKEEILASGNVLYKSGGQTFSVPIPRYFKKCFVKDVDRRIRQLTKVLERRVKFYTEPRYMYFKKIGKLLLNHDRQFRMLKNPLIEARIERLKRRRRQMLDYINLQCVKSGEYMNAQILNLNLEAIDKDLKRKHMSWQRTL